MNLDYNWNFKLKNGFICVQGLILMGCVTQAEFVSGLDMRGKLNWRLGLGSWFILNYLGLIGKIEIVNNKFEEQN